VRDDQIFALVALLCVLFWVASGTMPMRPELRRRVRTGAYVVLAVGLALALLRLVQYLLVN
jgi:multisubunit Na+/H+ antiporter MnhB subunit